MSDIDYSQEIAIFQIFWRYMYIHDVLAITAIVYKKMMMKVNLYAKYRAYIQ